MWIHQYNSIGASAPPFPWAKQSLQSLACGITPVLELAITDDYSLSNIGDPDPENTSYLVSNPFIAYTVNYNGSGAIGHKLGIGLRYDPTGSSNYGDEDYITPGAPWEGYSVMLDEDADNILTGSNSETEPKARTWKLADNHIVTSIGDKLTQGLVTCQYYTHEDESVIRVRMIYTNTTSVAHTVKMLRGLDPDVDVVTYGNYNTLNSRGLEGIPETDIVTAVGQTSGKALALYAPGNGFTHNTSVQSDWPVIDKNGIDITLTGFTETNNIQDDAILVAWDCGTVEPGQSVSVCCFYICGLNIAEVISTVNLDA